MRFGDPVDEQAFLDQLAERYVSRPTIVGFVVAAASWGVIAIWDAIVFQADAGRLIPLHAATNVPLLLASAAALARYGRRIPRKVIDWLPALVATAPGVTIVVGQAVGTAAYAPYAVSILAIYLICVHAYMGLRFRAASVVSAVLGAVSLAVAWASSSSGGEVFNDAVFVAAANLFGMQISYRTERYQRRDFLQKRALRAEQARSERLLHNMLPPPIAERLKQAPNAIADSFDAVTVLFADLVGFTQLSGRMAPADLVDLLNRIFTAFDRLAEQHGVEKIKTIGDAYMAVGGLTGGRRDHAVAVAGFALGMRAALTDLGPTAGKLEMRIGIHTGPVVAGVIGKSKYIYDLWGDTVNTASRMESHGKAGAIQISEVTRAALGETFAVEDRGLVEVKGKGEMRTFWLGSSTA